MSRLILSRKYMKDKQFLCNNGLDGSKDHSWVHNVNMRFYSKQCIFVLLMYEFECP